MSLRNLDSAFKPGSVALIGASREAGSVGAAVARNLFGAGFDGPILPIHPHARSVVSALAYPDVASLPVTPDLAVICTPPHTVPALIGQLGARGTRAAVVISAGFAELGAEGRDLQDRMLAAARPHLLRIIGPNCLGVLVPGGKLNASFAHRTPAAGPIAFVTQSGALLAAVLDWATTRGIGFSHLVSMGGMADVDFGDMLDYLAAEPEVRAILLYIEAITAPRKFLSAARAAARLKPVIAVKAGRHAEGARAAASHTGALAGSDIVYDAAFRRAGILRVRELEALFAAAETLSRGVRLTGERLAIITNGGGIGVLATDRLIDEGGVLAELSPETIRRLDAVLPPTWPKANPVDIIGDATGPRYHAAVEALFDDPGVGAMLVLNCPTAIADPADAAVAVGQAVGSGRARGQRTPVFATWLDSRNSARTEAAFAAAGIPTYASPERAVEAFMHLVRHDRARAQLENAPAAEDDGPARATIAPQPIIAGATAAGRQWLTAAEARQILNGFGIATIRGAAAADADDAVRAAAALGWPVALKIQSRDIVHKSDVGGVALDLATPDALRRAAEAMLARVGAARPDARIEGFSVEAMAPAGDAFELIVGMTDDPTFGPVLMFGAGGTAVELAPDRAIGLLPLDQTLAAALIDETKIARQLRGFRGRPGVDLRALAGILVRVSDLVIGVPEILELDINPLLARPDGFVALDARMRIGPAGTRRPLSITPYPRRLEATETLRDGATIRIRPVRPTDQSALCRLVERLDPEDRRLRFLGALQRLPPSLAARLCQIDYDREMALVATADDAPHDILGVVRLMADPDNRAAEYAVLVRSDLQGRGLGWCLMKRLIAYAADRGLGELTGKVLADNATMLRMAAELGFTLEASPDDRTIVDVRLRLGAP